MVEGKGMIADLDGSWRAERRKAWFEANRQQQTPLGALYASHSERATDRMTRNEIGSPSLVRKLVDLFKLQERIAGG